MLDLLLPRRCVVCGTPGALACADCVAQLHRIRAPLCERCGAPTAWPVRRCRECTGRRLAFASARAAIAYDEAARALVGAWKQRALRGLAATAGAIAADALEPPRVALLVPAPADPERGLVRGHHPAAALARELSDRWHLPTAAILARAHGPPQRGLGRAERRRNAASVAATGPAPTRVALVDDVYTTGATASAAASALRRAGAREVRVITLARTIRDGPFG
jgi:predicted amidophosphoribosyltransferase